MIEIRESPKKNEKILWTKDTSFENVDFGKIRLRWKSKYGWVFYRWNLYLSANEMRAIANIIDKLNGKKKRNKK